MEEFKQGEILLVEDSALEAELAMASLERESWASSITWVKDGIEALDYLFCRG